MTEKAAVAAAHTGHGTCAKGMTNAPGDDQIGVGKVLNYSQAHLWWRWPNGCDKQGCEGAEVGCAKCRGRLVGRVVSSSTVGMPGTEINVRCEV